MDGDSVTEVIELAREAQNLRDVIRKTEDGREFVMSEAGMPIWLSGQREAPNKIQGKRSFDEGVSFAAYVQKFKTDETLLFATTIGGLTSMTAQLDYHGKGKPQYNEHSAVWAMPVSIEWQVWVANQMKWMTQQDFMLHLETNAAEVVTPEAAKLMEIVADFEQVKTVSFKSSVKLSNGMRQLAYVEKDGTPGGVVQIPEKMTLSIPVFRGEARFTMTALIRTTTEGGVLKIRYDLHRHMNVVNDAFHDAAERIGKLCGLTPLYGVA